MYKLHDMHQHISLGFTFSRRSLYFTFTIHLPLANTIHVRT